MTAPIVRFNCPNRLAQGREIRGGDGTGVAIAINNIRLPNAISLLNKQVILTLTGLYEPPGASSSLRQAMIRSANVSTCGLSSIVVCLPGTSTTRTPPAANLPHPLVGS